VVEEVVAEAVVETPAVSEPAAVEAVAEVPAEAATIEDVVVTEATEESK